MSLIFALDSKGSQIYPGANVKVVDITWEDFRYGFNEGDEFKVSHFEINKFREVSVGVMRKGESG